VSERVPVYPNQHVPLVRADGPVWLGALELAAPLALGQRALVVGPSRTGKTAVLREVGRALTAAVPGIEVHVLLVDRPVEEFMEWRADLPHASVHGSSSEEGPEAHVAVDAVFDAAVAAAEAGRDAAVLVDSLAALARALNVVGEEDARILTGGILQQALRDTRARFATGRAYEPSGSLTIVATADVDTHSELDDVVFHELVGTGNMEIRMSADAADAGLFPPVDIAASGARHDEAIVGEAGARARAELRAEVAHHGITAGLALLLGELDRAGSLAALLEGRGT
jgi:transcription termination factor Rho